MNDVKPSFGQETPSPGGGGAPARIEAKANLDPAIRLFVAAAMFIGLGVWCFIDRNQFDPPAAWDREHINDAAKYAFNAFGAYVLVPPGVVLGVWGLLFLRRRVVADDSGIGYVGKDKLAWEAVTQVDATDLKSKNILRLYSGAKVVLTLDGWKLTRFHELVAMVESRIPAERTKT